MNIHVWDDEQFSLAEAIVEEVGEATEAIQLVAADDTGAEWNRTLARLEDALPMRIANGLSPLQHQVAVLHGRGVPFSTISDRLGIALGQLHVWYQSLPEFRRSVGYYREMMQHEIGGRTLGWVDRLLRDDSLGPKEITAVLRIAEKIGATPAERRDREIAHRVRLEAASMRENVQDESRVRGLQHVRVVDSVVNDPDADTDVGGEVDDAG